jgi:hypothetical protein
VVHEILHFIYRLQLQFLLVLIFCLFAQTFARNTLLFLLLLITGGDSKMNKIQAVLFDSDGTLADTLPMVYESFRKSFYHYKGRVLTNEQIISLFGPPEIEISGRAA